MLANQSNGIERALLPEIVAFSQSRLSSRMSGLRPSLRPRFAQEQALGDQEPQKTYRRIDARF
jgi:hypothetical protein